MPLQGAKALGFSQLASTKAGDACRGTVLQGIAVHVEVKVAVVVREGVLEDVLEPTAPLPGRNNGGRSVFWFATSVTSVTASP